MGVNLQIFHRNFFEYDTIKIRFSLKKSASFKKRIMKTITGGNYFFMNLAEALNSFSLMVMT